MPILANIPKRFKEGFAELSKLSEESFKQIENGLDQAEMCSYIEILASTIRKLTSIDGSIASKILNSVGGLVSFLDKQDDILDIVKDVTRLSISDNTIIEDSAEIFSDRLSVLLNNKKIFYASKAEDLISENSNEFLSCKIISDIRPVFDLDAEKQPEVGIIIHTLHLHYRSGFETPHKDVYLSLDTSDIFTLMESLERAIKKDESLNALMKKNGLNNLNE